MKILQVTPSYIPSYKHGGIPGAVHELCTSLVARGQEVLVITTNVNAGECLNVETNKIVNVDGVNVIYCPVNFPKYYFYSKDLKNMVKENILNFDIVHIQSIYSYPTAVTAHYCRKYKKPYLINPMGSLDPSMIRLRSYFRKNFYIKLIERHNIEKAKAIQVATDYEKDRFISLGMDTPVVVIPVSLCPAKYENPGTSLKEKYPELKGKRIVLFLGRIHVKKGLDLLAEAFKEVCKDTEDVFLVIAGPDDGYEEKIRDIFKKLGIMGRVVFTGLLAGNDKLAAFYDSELFVLSSYGENFAIAALEAMACGLPVVVTNKVGLYPDITEYNAGLVTDCEPGQIAKGIIDLLKDESLRKSMGANGRRLVKDRCSAERIADKRIGIYEDILSGKPVGGTA